MVSAKVHVKEAFRLPIYNDGTASFLITEEGTENEIARVKFKSPYDMFQYPEQKKEFIAYVDQYRSRAHFIARAINSLNGYE